MVSDVSSLPCPPPRSTPCDIYRSTTDTLLVVTYFNRCPEKCSVSPILWP